MDMYTRMCLCLREGESMMKTCNGMVIVCVFAKFPTGNWPKDLAQTVVRPHKTQNTKIQSHSFNQVQNEPTN